MQPRPTRLLSFSVLAAASLAACNAITGLGDDYHLGLGPDGVPLDADSSAESDGSTVDGGADSSVDGGFCDAARATGSGEVVFCNDFEGMTDAGGIQGASIDVTANAGASVTIVGAGDTHGNALEVDLPSKTQQQRRALLRVTLSGMARSFKRYHVEMDVHYVAKSNLQFAATGTLAFPSSAAEQSPPDYGIALLGENDQKFVPVMGGTPVGSAGASVTPGIWYAVSFDIEDVSDAGTNYRGTLKIDGQTWNSDAGPIQVGTNSAELWIGVYNTSPNEGAYQMRFDNVVVRRSN